MSIQLSFVLIAGSVFTFLFMMRLISKASIRIEDSIFWILFSGVLIVLSAFPQIAFFLSDIIKIQSPINLVYLIIIFILMINQFYLTIKVSRLIIKHKELVQKIALDDISQKENNDTQDR